MHVDKAGSDAASRGERIIRGTVGGKYRRDATVFDGNAADRRCSVADGEKGRA
jgi:hypothetical protein